MSKEKTKTPVSMVAISTTNVTMPGATEPNISIIGLGSDGRTYCWSHVHGIWLPNWAAGMNAVNEALKKKAEEATAAASGLPSPAKRADLRKKRK